MLNISIILIIMSIILSCGRIDHQQHQSSHNHQKSSVPLLVEIFLKQKYNTIAHRQQRQINKQNQKTKQMFRKLFRKIIPKKEEQETMPKLTGINLKQKIRIIIKQQSFQSSNFYINYLNDFFLQPMSVMLDQKMRELQHNFEKSLAYEMQLASISLSICEQYGLLYNFVKLWISFCEFELKNIIQKYQVQVQGEGQNQDLENKEKRSKQITTFFKRQFFLLTFFIYNICLYLYEKPISKSPQFNDRNLFSYIRDNLTMSPKWKNIHTLLRKNIEHPCKSFTDAQVKQNMNQLEKLVKISTIPVPFMESIAKLKQVWSLSQIESKIKSIVALRSTVYKQIDEYRTLNNFNQNYVITADDVFSVITYALWKVKKNIYGACKYIQLILCCEYEEINEANVSAELQLFDEDARHAYQTLESIAKISLLKLEQEELIQ